MMLGERHRPSHLLLPTWPLPDEDSTAAPFSPDAALRLLLLSPRPYADAASDSEPDDLDAYACDSFRMYEFKIRRCTRSRSHDWTECPFAHPGEKARRRDPRKFRYSGIACPDFRKGSCRKGDACEFAHGVFECWLHPSRYRTQACKDGINCRRRVCFFAHTPDQLRVLPHACGSPPRSYDGSPMRLHDGDSSPSPSLSAASLLGSLRLLRLGAGSARSAPPTPTGLGWGEPAERVESGRELRARIAERLSRENPLSPAVPDVNWVSDLVN